MNGNVNGLAVFNDGGGPALNAGGDFTAAGSVTSNRIAKWKLVCPIYVNANATGTNNGLSWANAFTRLQDALAAATPDDEIWVAAGTYKPDRGTGITLGDRTATFQLKSGVALYGGFAGSETVLSQRNVTFNETILSGDLSGNDGPNFANYGENSFHVVTGSSTNSTAILDGFTITGGNADGSNNGGGMLISSGSPTVRQCWFFQNRSTNNGGAIYVATSSSHIVDCRFIGNQADGGGGIYSGGTIFISNCSFYGNSTTGIGPIAGGAAVNVRTSSAALANCLISGNSSQDYGGGILVSSGASAFLRNCTIVANIAGSASRGGGVQVHAAGSSILLENCILYGNVNGQIEGNGTATVNYSLVQGGFSGTQNIDENPLFVDADGADNVTGTEDDDLRLTSASPCIDAGSRAAVPADATDLDGDGNTSELTPYDLDGNPRIRDVPTVVDTGAGGFPVVDMGAYEFQPPFVDCNLNGVADDLDILNNTSLDLDHNGIPDECVDFISGCLADPRWSCPGNWDLGGIFPNNAAATYSVTLDSTTDAACLDVTVTIDTLRIIHQASLDMSGMGSCTGDLTLAKPGGLLIEDNSSLTLGPGRTIHEPVSPSGASLTLRNSGALEVDDSTIALTGDMTVEFGGRYESSPGAGTNAASLAVNNITVRSSPSGSYPSESFDISGQMTVIATGDLTIDGTGVTGSCSGALRGGHTPPIIRVRNQGGISVTGTMGMFAAANLIVNSSNAVTVGGDFNNQSTRPDCFFCSTGKFMMNGTTPQVFEVAATDVGTLPDLSTAQYVIGALEIAGGADVTFRDSFDNDTSGQGACTEALYLDTLVLDAGSTITLDNCHVYFQTLVRDPIATITLLGCADLQQVNCPFTQPASPEPNPIAKNRYISFLPSNSGMQTALRVTMVSLQHPDPPNLPQFPPHNFSAIEGQVRWVGTPGNCTETESPPTTFKCASLQCTPQYLDWPAATGGQVLHVTGPAIMPSSTYKVEAIAQSTCDTNQPFNYSAPLTITTARWGDVATPFQGPLPAPLTQPNIGDIAAVVDKFKAVPTAVIVARADLNPGIPNFKVDISDVANCVDAFKNIQYLFAGPAACP